MAPRNTSRQGASTNARRTATGRSGRAASSTRATARTSPAKKAAPARSAAKSKRPAPKRPPAAKRSRLIPSVSAPILAILVIAAVAWSFYPVMRVQYQEERNRAALQSELEGLQERNDRLRAQVDRLKTPEGVEELARENLGMVKEGENLYVVMDGTEATPTLEVDDGRETVGNPTPWQRLLDTLFGFDG